MAKSIRGAPRYLVGRCAIVSPRIIVMLFCVEIGVLKKKIWDLESLMERPEAWEKRFKMALKEQASWTEWCPKSILSSMNCWWVVTGDPWREMPLRIWLLTPLWISLLRPSAIRTKRKGERGSPCLIPLVGEKGGEGIPLTRIEKKVEEMRFIIHLIHNWWKPKSFKICWM